MIRILLILLIGGALGYGYGFRDARMNKETVVTRVLDRLGGDARKYSKHDAAEEAMKQAER